MSNKVEECKKFLCDNKVTFDQLIRCFNFWQDLYPIERNDILDADIGGEFDGVGGWY